jgi:heat shock protein HslJ
MKPIVLLSALALLGGCTGLPGGGSDAPLLDTRWTAIELEGMAIDSGPGKREVHLILRRDDATASGFSGCNSIRGGYALSDERLQFKPMASTRMACLPGAGDTEQRYHSALAATAAFRVSGDTLELRDSAGTVRARFQARPRP